MRDRCRYFMGGVVFAVCIVLPAVVAKAFGKAVWIGRGQGK